MQLSYHDLRGCSVWLGAPSSEWRHDHSISKLKVTQSHRREKVWSVICWEHGFLRSKLIETEDRRSVQIQSQIKRPEDFSL